MNSSKQIAVYDNTVTARTYLSYISEQAGGFAVIGRDGKLYIKTIGEDTAELALRYFSEYSWGEQFKVSRIAYEDGVQNLKKGDETNNTIWISSDNMYIVDQEQIDNIYNSYKDFEVYSFSGTSIVDPAWDIGDILIIDNKKIVYQGELEYKGKFKANISSDIQAKTKEETTATKISNDTKIRRVQSQINQVEGTITQLVQETSEFDEKISQVEQSVDEISQQVSEIADITRTEEGYGILHITEAMQADAGSFKIYGSTENFKYLTPSNTLVPSNSLVPLGGDFTICIDKQTKLNPSSEIKQYKIKLDEPLRNVGDVCDEFVVSNSDSIAKVIRRIGVNTDGTLYILENEIEEIIGELHLTLFEGENYVYLKEFNNVKCEIIYAILNDFTENFATNIEVNSKISQTSSEIMTEVNKKVDEEEFGTKIEQNWEHVKVAWNQISDYIQMMILNGTASLAILDDNGNMLMSLDKTGQDFYETGQKFGEMGVKTEENEEEQTDRYISFSVDGEYDSSVSDGMAWGITTKSDNKFHPIFYISDFYVPPKNSEGVMGDLILSSGRFILNSINASIEVGGIAINGDELDGLFFTDGDGNVLLQISKGNVIENASINILDKIRFFKNSAGNNSFRIGGMSDNDDYCLLTDEGHISCKELSCLLGTISCQTLQCYGNIYCNNGVQPFSLAEKKKNIRKYNNKALDQIMNTDIYYYNYKDDKDDCKTRIGAIIGDKYKCSKEIIGSEGKGIDTYSMISVAYKAIQEQQEIIEDLQRQINELKGESNG